MASTVGQNPTTSCLTVLSALIILRCWSGAAHGHRHRPPTLQPLGRVVLPTRHDHAGDLPDRARGRAGFRLVYCVLIDQGDNFPTRRIALALLVATLLVACGGTPLTQPAADRAAAFNDADIQFLQAMLPHHQQAIDMARLVKGRTLRPELTELAINIVADQGAEIRTMQAWLRSWGRPMPAMQELNEGDEYPPGMLGSGQIPWLRALKGKPFDLGFLTMMRTHHYGAVEMAELELRTGASSALKKLASQIIASQQTEIRQMITWKQAWS